MIIADTSALLSLATGDVLEVVLSEFDIHTTETVIEEVEAPRDYEDVHAEAAAIVLEQSDQLTIHETEEREFTSSRIDTGEASCIVLEHDHEAEFLLTDDLRALPELQHLVARAQDGGVQLVGGYNVRSPDPDVPDYMVEITRQTKRIADGGQDGARATPESPTDDGGFE